MKAEIYPKPPLITRTEWGCPDGQITNHGPLSYTTVTHLIVHHTVNDNVAADWREVVLNIWKFHVVERGFADIGYNYLIDPNGVIYEGRAGGDDVQGAHFSGVNAGTMGVGMVGTYLDVEPTKKALLSLKKLLTWKCDQCCLDPMGSSLHAASQLNLCTISGHCDGPRPTQCPGTMLYALLPKIRVDIKRRIRNKQR
jgi:N-acetylmuramoyl-L-alanine amidase-like protein